STASEQWCHNLLIYLYAVSDSEYDDDNKEQTTENYQVSSCQELVVITRKTSSAYLKQSGCQRANSVSLLGMDFP
ncbi:unnamed protein product, partial [Choristocarpus tenellus]